MRIQTLYILTFLALGFTSVHSEEAYHAPEFGLKERKLDHIEAKQNQWDSGLRFKIQQQPLSERAIASDEAEPAQEFGRDPSSTYEPLELNFNTDVQKWRWKDLEHQP